MNFKTNIFNFDENGKPIRKFLFKCDYCEMIVSIELTDQKDIDDVNDDLFKFKCDCGGSSAPLRD